MDDLLQKILGWILERIFYGGSFMEASGVDSAMDSDSDLIMMDSGEDSGVDSGMDLMKSQK